MLNLYSDFLNINPYAFFGINYLQGNYQSHKIWTASERAQVLRAMLISSAELEQNLGYLLMPRFSVEEPHVYTAKPTRLNHAFIIALGSQTTTDLADAAVDYDAEPATVEITTDAPDDIHLFNPSTDEEIAVSQRDYTGGVLTLSIYRYNLLVDKNNPVAGWDYEELDNFQNVVAVKLVTVDDTLTVQSGYTTEILNYKMGYLQASYSLTVTPASDTMLINYQSGLEAQDYALKNAWVDFAHARMDIQPTTDPYVYLKWLWARDIPKEMSTAQRECTFGQFAGSYQAWRYINNNRLHRASPL